MRSGRFCLVGAGFLFLLVCFSNPADARVSGVLSIGISFGYRYPGSCYGYYPYDPWHGGYYSWWDTGWHRRFPRRHYWPRHSYPSVGVLIGNCNPAFIGVPIEVRRSSIGTACNKSAGSVKRPTADAQLTEAMRKKKSEWLKIHKTGDKEKRIRVIHELVPFSFDNEIRRALEGVMLSDPDPKIRKEVAASFGRTKNRLLLAALKEAKEKDPERNVRQAAYKAIIMIEGY